MGAGLGVKANCGMCVHHHNIAHPAYEGLCRELGIQPENLPCTRFAPDYRQLKIADDERFASFAHMVAGMSDNSRMLLASVLLREGRTQKNGYRFGESVYIKVFQNDYVLNYRRAVVVAADRHYVYVEGAKGLHAMVLHDNVLNARRWARKKVELEAAGRVLDPLARKYLTRPTNFAARVQDIIDNDKLELIEAQTRTELQIMAAQEQARPPGPPRARKRRSLVELFGGEPESEADAEVGKVRVRRSSGAAE